MNTMTGLEVFDNTIHQDGLIIRTESQEMKPMFVEDSAQQLEEIGPDFLLFLNAEDQVYKVVYRWSYTTPLTRLLAEPCPERIRRDGGNRTERVEYTMLGPAHSR